MARKLIKKGSVKKTLKKSSKKIKAGFKNSKAKLKERINKTRQKIKTRFFTFISTVLFIALIVALFYSTFESLIQSSIAKYGLFAIFSISFLSDLILQPLGPDVPIFAGIVLGLNPISVILVATFASTIATILGYYLGFRYGAKGFKLFYGEKKYNKISKTYDKYDFIVPIAALTPVPYVPICWISGIMRMKFIRFLLYAIIPRTIRFLIVALFAYGFFN